MSIIYLIKFNFFFFYFSDDICILSAYGTAVIINFHKTDELEDYVGLMKQNIPQSDDLCASLDQKQYDKDKHKTVNLFFITQLLEKPYCLKYFLSNSFVRKVSLTCNKRADHFDKFVNYLFL